MKTSKPILLALFIFNTLYVFSNATSEPSAMPEGKVFKAVDKVIKTLAVLDSIRVYTGNAAGQEKITKLKSAGYVCRPALSKLWRCTTHLNQWNHDPKKIRSRISGIKQSSPNLTFGRVWGEIEKTHHSEAFSEWEVEQIVKVGDLETRYFRWRDLNGTDYLKLLPGKQGFIQEFLWSNDQLSKIISFSMAHKDGYTRYLIEIPYE